MLSEQSSPKATPHSKLSDAARAKLKARADNLALEARQLGRDEPPHPDPSNWFDRESLRLTLFGPPGRAATFTLKLFIEMHVGRTAAPPPSGGFLSSAWHWIAQRWAPLGVTHAAAQVGAHTLHWRADSLVSVESIMGTNAVLLFCDGDGQVPMAQQDALLDVVLHWNEKVWYRQGGDNCQAFVMALHAAVGRRLVALEDSSHALSRFVQCMKNAGSDETVYPMLVRASGTTLGPWRSHHELDQWCVECELDLRPGLSTDEVALLKSFHRGFQVRGDMGFGGWMSGGNPPVQCQHASVTLLTSTKPGSMEENEAQRCFYANQWVAWHEAIPRSVTDARGGVRLLALEHGGVRGVALLWALHALEVATRRYCWEMFDVVCGVGSGAVAAMALVCFRMPVLQLLEYYRTLGEQSQCHVEALRLGAYVFDSLAAYWHRDLKTRLSSMHTHPRLVAVGRSGVPVDTKAATVESLVASCAGGWPAFPWAEAAKNPFPSAVDAGVAECKRLWPVDGTLECVVMLSAQWTIDQRDADKDKYSKEEWQCMRDGYLATAPRKDMALGECLLPICHPVKLAFALQEARQPVQKFSVDGATHEQVGTAAARLTLIADRSNRVWRGRPVMVKEVLGDQVRIEFRDEGTTYSCPTKEWNSLKKSWDYSVRWLRDENGTSVYEHTVFNGGTKPISELSPPLLGIPLKEL